MNSSVLEQTEIEDMTTDELVNFLEDSGIPAKYASAFEGEARQQCSGHVWYTSIHKINSVFVSLYF